MLRALGREAFLGTLNLKLDVRENKLLLNRPGGRGNKVNCIREYGPETLGAFLSMF
jgi:hypothetical protein